MRRVLCHMLASIWSPSSFGGFRLGSHGLHINHANFGWWDLGSICGKAISAKAIQPPGQPKQDYASNSFEHHNAGNKKCACPAGKNAPAYIASLSPSVKAFWAVRIFKTDPVSHDALRQYLPPLLFCNGNSQGFFASANWCSSQKLNLLRAFALQEEHEMVRILPHYCEVEKSRFLSLKRCNTLNIRRQTL